VADLSLGHDARAALAPLDGQGAPRQGQGAPSQSQSHSQSHNRSYNQSQGQSQSYNQGQGQGQLQMRQVSFEMDPPAAFASHPGDGISLFGA